MHVAYLDEEGDAARWDAFVGPRACSVTDLSAWHRVVGETYGLRSHLLAALADDVIVGTLGLVEVRHPVFGRYLTTAIFGSNGGLHYDCPAARDLLTAEARELACRLGVAHLVIRTGGPALEGFRLDGHYRTAILDLAGGSDSVWRRLPDKTRNQVRRGTKEGFTLETGHAQLGPFHDVFHEHMRDLGSPAHSRRFYESIVAHLGERAEFFVLRDRGELAAGALLFWLNGTAMNLHTVALRRFNRRCPNYLLYWKLIETSIAHDCIRLDMGRSEAESPNMRFKGNWRPTELSLFYDYFLPQSGEIPYLDPRNPKYRAAIAVWQRLPLFLTRRLGPHLITGLG